MYAGITVLGLFLMILTLFVLRILYLIYQIFGTDCGLEIPRSSLQTIFCIGSGGHTTEMLKIMQNLNLTKYHPRLYILADSDISSEVKIHRIEQSASTYSISKIPRSRNVKQSYITSVISTCYAIICTIPVVYKFKPHIVFCNGPGTCIPISLVAFMLRCLFIIDCRIVFIESICRVQTLSLTGKILQFFADIVVVQWPQLRDVCFRAKYFGRLT